MKLKDIGEKALLELAQEICEKGPSIRVGVGDDGAVVEMDGELLVTTTDMILEGVHFTPDTTAYVVGRKAVVINVSDLAAMGAEPLGLVYSIGAPGDTDVDFISGLLEAMNSAARAHGTYILGGDLNEAEQVIVSGTAFGKTTEDRLLLRSGAKVGDVIGVTGELGGSSAATEALLNDISLEKWSSLEAEIVEPRARIAEGRALAENGGVSSAIDITDGLASNLWQISRMSGVGLIVDHEKVPVNGSARKFALEEDFNLFDIVFFGGEDFEILFTIDPGKWEKLKRQFGNLGTKISRIGEVITDEDVLLRREGKIEKLPDRGYEHFR